jgi:hypothetical protein
VETVIATTSSDWLARAGAVTGGGIGLGLGVGLLAWAIAHDVLKLAGWLLRRPLAEQQLPGLTTFLEVCSAGGAFVAILIWLFENGG